MNACHECLTFILILPSISLFHLRRHLRHHRRHYLRHHRIHRLLPRMCLVLFLPSLPLPLVLEATLVELTLRVLVNVLIVQFVAGSGLLHSSFVANVQQEHVAQ